MKIVPSHYPPAISSRFAPTPTKKVGVIPAATPVLPSRGRPIELYDVVTVQSNAEQAFQSRAFQNNTTKVIELHAMSISCEFQSSTVNSGLVLGTAFIAIQAAVGRIAADAPKIPMTRGFVPAWLLAPSDNRRNETQIVAATLGKTQTVWKFASPIYLNPGELVSVQAQHLGYISGPVDVHVAFEGSLVASAQGTRRIPYAFYWAGDAFTFDEAGFDESPPAALANDVGRPLKIERFIGRFASFEAVGGVATQKSLNDFGDLSNQMETTRVRLGISLNRPILRQFCPWLAVFGNNAALECDFVLSPSDYISASVQHVAGTALAQPSPFFTGQSFISVVGSREA